MSERERASERNSPTYRPSTASSGVSSPSPTTSRPVSGRSTGGKKGFGTKASLLAMSGRGIATITGKRPGSEPGSSRGASREGRGGRFLTDEEVDTTEEVYSPVEEVLSWNVLPVLMQCVDTYAHRYTNPHTNLPASAGAPASAASPAAGRTGDRDRDHDGDVSAHPLRPLLGSYEAAYPPLDDAPYAAHMLLRTVRVVANICAGTVDHIQYALDAGAVAQLVSLLAHAPQVAARAGAASLVERGVASRSPSPSQSPASKPGTATATGAGVGVGVGVGPGDVADAGAEGGSHEVPASVTLAVLTEAASALANITARGSPEQAMGLVTDLHVIPVLSGIFDIPLMRPDVDLGGADTLSLVSAALEALENVLKKSLTLNEKGAYDSCVKGIVKCRGQNDVEYLRKKIHKKTPKGERGRPNKKKAPSAPTHGRW